MTKKYKISLNIALALFALTVGIFKAFDLEDESTWEVVVVHFPFFGSALVFMGNAYWYSRSR